MLKLLSVILLVTMIGGINVARSQNTVQYPTGYPPGGSQTTITKVPSQIQRACGVITTIT